jgi:16S rRNA (uracil1498-N3)-methyltransferase
MPHHRYYFDAFFQENETIVLANDEFHHLARVLRAKKGECVELVNGRGQIAQATVMELKKHVAELQIHRASEEITQKTPLILVQALTRMNHLEWTIEKGTELGVSAFWLFPGILSEKTLLSQTQCARLKHLVISAMKQCGRLDLPAIEIKPPLLKWTALPGTLLFGDTVEQAPYLWDLPLIKPLPAPIFIFIGPESGFDAKEHVFLQDSLYAKGVRLHSNILRTETAPLVALSLIQKYI